MNKQQFTARKNPARVNRTGIRLAEAIDKVVRVWAQQRIEMVAIEAAAFGEELLMRFKAFIDVTQIELVPIKLSIVGAGLEKVARYHAQQRAELVAMEPEMETEAMDAVLDGRCKAFAKAVEIESAERTDLLKTVAMTRITLDFHEKSNLIPASFEPELRRIYDRTMKKLDKSDS